MKQNNFFSIDYFAHRDEDDKTLIYFADNDNCFVVNAPAKQILDFIREKKTFEEICALLKILYPEIQNLESEIKLFIELLENHKVLNISQSRNLTRYATPSIKPLESVMEKGHQCGIFGMP